MRLRFVIALAWAASLGACVRSQWVPLECGVPVRPRPALVRDSAGAPPGELSGIVTLGHPGGRPLEQARVWLAGPRADSVTADSVGRFRFAGLPAGRYVLRVRYLGVSPRTDTLDLSPAAGASLVLPLAGPHPDECANVLVRRRRR